MKNLTLFALAAASILAVAGVACSSSDSDTTAGDDSSSLAGSGGSAGAAEVGGSGGTAAGTSVIDALFPADNADYAHCRTCLQTMTGTVDDGSSMTDCSTVVAACGANNENCSGATTCVGKAYDDAAAEGSTTSVECDALACDVDAATAEPAGQNFITCLLASAADHGCGDSCFIDQTKLSACSELSAEPTKKARSPRWPRLFAFCSPLASSV